MLAELKEKIEASNMILVGLGEEFNDISSLKKSTDYMQGKQWIEDSDMLWLLPAHEQECRENMPARVRELREALDKLAELLKEKNYFVISTSENVMIRESALKPDRLVMPCGGTWKKQCISACEEVIQPVTEAERQAIRIFLKEKKKLSLGECPKCGKQYILNNIYAEHYDENGYLEQWQLYTKWLQGTLNKNVLILELGVGMRFPSVIRFPFEKIAYFNQKASFYRVNESLYQMSEELKDKGVSIPQNAIDWLRGVC